MSEVIAIMEPEKRQTNPEKPVKKNLNVSLADGERIAKIAAHRGKSIEELFAEPDVREFFKHLLIAEMEKEKQRLKGKS